MSYRRPEPLEKHHITEDFDSGSQALDAWLAKYALASQAEGSARVLVTADDEHRVLGYFALTAASVEPRDATARLAKGQPAHRPIPVVLLARLAVDLSHQGKGLGRSLLQESMLRTFQASEHIGVRAMLVHAKDEGARAFYEQYGFESSPTDELHLILLMKDLRAFLGSAGAS